MLTYPLAVFSGLILSKHLVTVPGQCSLLLYISLSLTQKGRWENVPYVVMEKPYPGLPVSKVRSSERDDKPRVLHHILLFHYSVPSKTRQNLMMEVGSIPWDGMLQMI